MKLKKSISVLLFLSFLLGVVFIPGIPDVNAQTDTQAFAQSYLDEQMEACGITGVVYMSKDGEVLCESARGMANTDEGTKITVDTLFPIGSVSKQFCATAVLLLQEQGKLSVDDTLAEYFPEYTKAKDVTIENLLTMRSGIPDHLAAAFTEYTLSVEATEEENQSAILSWLYEKDLLSKPGAVEEYSNTNFFLLSLIVEQASGQSYSDFIEENIFTPLEMTNSGFYEELLYSPDLAENTAQYELPLEAELKGFTQGAGDLVSNAEDMDKWMNSLRNCTILTEESIAEMTDNQYGIGVTNDGGINSLGAIGAIASYTTVQLTYPEEGFNIFAVTNDYENGLDVFSSHVFDMVEELRTEKIYGDVNFDGTINIKDASRIQKFCAKIFSLNTAETLCADVNGDEKVNVKDATAIQKHIAKIETNLPIGSILFDINS